jgi:hypothetical protein
MLPRTNIESILANTRDKRISEELLMEEVQHIFTENEIEREEILASLTTTPKDSENCLDVSLLDSNCIFHIQDIQKICVTYRLRFLDSHFFKGEFPKDMVSFSWNG